jgi:hypothetical protein
MAEEVKTHEWKFTSEAEADAFIEGLTFVPNPRVMYGRVSDLQVDVHVSTPVVDPPEEDGPPFFCRGCGREELECSKDPCPGVIADRES